MHCVFVYNLRQCIFTDVVTEALYEKKQSIVLHDSEFAKLQAQVKELESPSPGKDSEYEAIVNKSEGEVI